MEPVLKDERACDLLARRAALVSRYATPLAVLVVALGILVSQPVGWVRNSCIGLLVFGILFNVAAVPLICRMKDPRACIHVRVGVNLAANTALVYLLGAYWKPAWLLLALTPLATAIYDSRGRTLASALGVSALLLGVQALRRHSSPLDWGEAAACSLFMVLVSLLVHDLAADSRAGN